MARTSEKPNTPVRKGDVVAVETRHSYQSLKDGHQVYYTWHIATVTSASRDGWARTVQLAGYGYSRALDANDDVRAISGTNQKLAVALAASIASPDSNNFDHVDKLRSAILAMAADLNARIG